MTDALTALVALPLALAAFGWACRWVHRNRHRNATFRFLDRVRAAI